MKAQLFAGVLLMAIFALAIAQGGNHSMDDDGPQCRRNVQRSCTSSSRSCGRLGRANICQAFQNDCQRQLNNCGGNKATKFYRRVNRNLCRGMELDQALPCGSGGRTRRNDTTNIIKF